MRFSLKKTAFTLCIFFTGIFISELIAHEPLIYKGTQGIKMAIENAMALDGFWTTFWTAFTGLATFVAASSAITIAKSGRDREDRLRIEDQAKRENEKQKEIADKRLETQKKYYLEENQRTLVTSLYFGSLAKASSSLTYQNFGAIKAHLGNSILSDIRSRWMDALKDTDMSKCLNDVNTLNSREIHVLDEFERFLGTSLTVIKILERDFTILDEEDPRLNERKEILELLDNFQTLLWLIKESAHLLCLRAIQEYLRLEGKQLSDLQKEDITTFEDRVAESRANLVTFIQERDARITILKS